MMIDSFEWVNSQDWGIESLKAALANEMEHTRKLEENNASLARKIERLSIELEDAQAMVRTLMEQRTASHDTEYGKVMAKRIIQEQER